MEIVHIPSPHGREGNVPQRIIIHAMGEYIAWQGERLHAREFLDAAGLSCHVLIGPDGTRYRCRDDSQIAYHARGNNHHTLGIEVLHPEAVNIGQLKRRTAQSGWVSGEQYAAVEAQCREWMQLHGIPADSVSRHSDLSPRRRWYDPGEGFPWSMLMHDLERDR